MSGGKDRAFSVKDIALLGIMIATMEVGKLALAGVPNVEIVTLLIILYTLHFGKRSLYAVLVFVVLECAVWGVGLWTIMYLYIWPLVAVVTYALRKIDSHWFWCIMSGIFGITFGALGSLVYLFTGGAKVAFAWWVTGIPWDIVHGVSNFIIMMVLYHPLRRVMKKFA